MLCIESFRVVEKFRTARPGGARNAPQIALCHAEQVQLGCCALNVKDRSSIKQLIDNPIVFGLRIAAEDARALRDDPSRARTLVLDRLAHAASPPRRWNIVSTSRF